MFVVHGLWSVCSGLCLWAEDSAAVGTAAPRASSDRGGVGLHPFAVAPGVLAAALDLRVEAHGDLTLLLPTAMRRPVPS
ncbi:MAG: hypothetical protein ACRDZ7_04960, partial [Acidimicrobiia bacterium]